MTPKLLAPPGHDALPGFDRGWTVEGAVEPFLSYVEDAPVVNWSDQLEEIHEESSRSHFIDRWTRRAMLKELGDVPPGATVLDLGCSSGYLLEDLQATHPEATLIGIDLVGAGLRRAHVHVPEARLLQADAGALPLADGSVDAVLSANLLEHVSDDTRVLRELCRVLRPGASAILVVPAGPHLYDYYDRFLGHQRRYGAGELAARAQQAGLTPMHGHYLGSFLYPAFWLVKQRNRRRFGHLDGATLQARVERDIAHTRSSRAGAAACRLEEWLVDRGVRLPFGIRELIVLRAP
jgi:ubiquinone/menaquinone biosynthesis C-methylase UbiE